MLDSREELIERLNISCHKSNPEIVLFNVHCYLTFNYRVSPKKYFWLGTSHNVQNTQISLYPKFQTILFKIDIAVYVFSLVQAALKEMHWAE